MTYEQIKAARDTSAAVTAQLDSILAEFDMGECPHSNCAIVADSTMGKDADGNWNQKYICQDCQQEVTEDEYLCSKER